ncbi:MAG: signal peptidase II [Deltaproteobacteria bacterium]|nr:signal peptidase II [Deltaproteobacteria bacterium]
MLNRRNGVFLLVTFLGVLLDQVTKGWVVQNIDLHSGAIEVIPGFFEIVHSQNPGAAMGLLRDNPYRHQLFLGFTIIAVVVILDLFRRLPRNDAFMATTLGLILSGAIGNGIDRVRQQYVTDFLRFFTENPGTKAWLGSYGLPAEYPSFNVADSALVVGVGMFLLHYMFLEEKEPEAPKIAPPQAPPETPASPAT